MFMPLSLFFFLGLCAFGMVAYIIALRVTNHLLRAKLNDALHKKTEISNFLSLFAQNLRSVEEIDNSMNMTARYVADLIEAQSICIFELDNGFLRAVGISGAFPPLHKSSEYVLTKPRYILESLRRDRIKVGDGLIGEIAANREMLCLEDASKDSRIAGRDTVVPIHTLMAVPLIQEGNVTGVICAVNNRRNERPFSAEQFSRFKFIASQVVLAQNIVQVYSSLSEQQRINQELEFARQLQASLLPERFPPWDQFVVHSFTRSSKEVNGDFYDFVEIDDDRLLIVVGDACGKGVPACMIMAMARSFIRSHISHFTTLEALLCDLNANLYRDTAEGRFITLACCLLDRREGSVEYARAGHTELIIHVRKHIRSMYPEGAALGLLPSDISSFETVSFEFTPDMSLLLFTDGIIEATNSKMEEFGTERLRQRFNECCGQYEHPEEVVQKILESVDEYTEGQQQADDQTMVLLRHS